MGGSTFYTTSKGKTAREAFDCAVTDAQYDHGHGGYSGTIAEKRSFTMIPLPKGTDPYNESGRLIDAVDLRVDDKWGPAGCFDLGDGSFFFFGWASD